MLTAGIRLGPYEILSALGAGGMGEVYKARDTRLDRVVAIKVLTADLTATDDARQRFEREARAISQLNHPNICTGSRRDTACRSRRSRAAGGGGARTIPDADKDGYGQICLSVGGTGEAHFKDFMYKDALARHWGLEKSGANWKAVQLDPHKRSAEVTGCCTQHQVPSVRPMTG